MVWVALTVLWFVSGMLNPAPSPTASDWPTTPADRLVAVRRSQAEADAPKPALRVAPLHDALLLEVDSADSAEHEPEETVDESPTPLGRAI